MRSNNLPCLYRFTIPAVIGETRFSHASRSQPFLQLLSIIVGGISMEKAHSETLVIDLAQNTSAWQAAPFAGVCTALQYRNSTRKRKSAKPNSTCKDNVQEKLFLYHPIAKFSSPVYYYSRYLFLSPSPRVPETAA